MTVFDFVLPLSGVVLTLLGAVLTMSHPVQDWKVLYGFCLFIVGILHLVMELLW